MTSTETKALKDAAALPRSDLLWKLADLHKQATMERSHFYTGRVILDAIVEITALRADTSGEKP